MTGALLPVVPAPPPRSGTNVVPIISPLSGSMIYAGGHEQNTGGKPGRSGRKSNDFKRICRRIIEDPRVMDTLEEMLFAREQLVQPDGTIIDRAAVKPTDFIAMLDTLAKYVVQKPTATTRLEGGLTLEALVAGSLRDSRVDDEDGDEVFPDDDHETVEE